MVAYLPFPLTNDDANSRQHCGTRGLGPQPSPDRSWRKFGSLAVTVVLAAVTQKLASRTSP